MIRTIRNHLIEAYKRYTHSLAKAPVFVYGNQKSGTSAIAALLGEATGSSYTIDVFHRFGDLEEKLVNGDVRFEKFLSLATYYFSRKIIKEPTLTLYHPELKKCFPDARFVFIVRDPRDNIRSILNRLELPGNLEDLDFEQKNRVDSISIQWRMIMSGEAYRHRGKNYIETLAQRYNKMVDVYAQDPRCFLLVRYEDFIQSKTEHIRKLAGELGLPMKRDISAIVDQEFQPKGKKVKSYADFFGEKNLGTIENTCSSYMRLFGYASE